MSFVPFPVIDLRQTGRNIEQLRRNAGLSVRALQDYFGFEYPQAIYKWQHGECLPSVDNLLALSRLLDVPIEELLVCKDQERPAFGRMTRAARKKPLPQRQEHLAPGVIRPSMQIPVSRRPQRLRVTRRMGNRPLATIALAVSRSVRSSTGPRPSRLITLYIGLYSEDTSPASHTPFCL